jgi:hypothetical protein
MREKSFLAAWCRGFGALFAVAGFGLFFWTVSLTDTEKVIPTVLSALCVLGGTILLFLGKAFGWIHQLECRVNELEQRQQGGPERRVSA